MTVIGVLAVQGDVSEHLRSLELSGASARIVKLPHDLEDLDGLLIPGGESTAIANLLERQGLIDPIRQLISSGLPVFGSCAGLILLADVVEGGIENQVTLGGLDVVVRRNAFGRQVSSFEAPVSVDILGDIPILGIFIRAPWIEEVGPGVDVLGSVRDEEGVQRVVVAQQGNILATSFHPELTDDLRLHQYFIAMAQDRDHL